MNLKDRMIIEDYRKNRDSFIRLGDIVHEKLQEITKRSYIEVMTVEHRVKSEASLEEKLERKGDQYQSLDDLTDILGARIICFFEDDVDAIGKMVEETFAVDWDNSSDKRALIKADAFGYLSLHYICSLPFNAGYPEELCGKRFEIQIRTNLQHTWSAIQHDLGYKTPFGVPREITREFARVAGLLEVADAEFVRVREKMKTYEDDTRRKITENHAADISVNLVSLREYMRLNGSMREFLNKLASFSNAEIQEVEPESYIEQLLWLNVRTLGDLQKMLERDAVPALELAEQTLRYSELDIISSTAALRYLCRAELLRGGYTKEQAVEFLMISLRDRQRAERQAEMLFRSSNNNIGEGNKT